MTAEGTCDAEAPGRKATPGRKAGHEHDEDPPPASDTAGHKSIRCRRVNHCRANTRTATVTRQVVRPAVHEVEQADKVSALYDETPRTVGVELTRSAPGKEVRGVRRRLPPIAFADDAVFRKALSRADRPRALGSLRGHSVAPDRLAVTPATFPTDTSGAGINSATAPAPPAHK
jgi:hypothetical protein